MPVRFKTNRFHVSYGPGSLFERIAYVMAPTEQLKLNAKHFTQRASERLVPDEVLESLQNFNPAQWELITAEVRIDTGKFVNSTWSRMFNDDVFWITIGFGNTVETIIRKDRPDTYYYTTSGDLYYFVAAVNADLMLKIQAE